MLKKKKKVDIVSTFVLVLFLLVTAFSEQCEDCSLLTAQTLSQCLPKCLYKWTIIQMIERGTGHKEKRDLQLLIKFNFPLFQVSATP